MQAPGKQLAKQLNAPDFKEAVVMFWTERCRSLLQERNNLTRDDLEYTALVVSKLKDERLKESIMYPCRTNRHTWLDPVSAERCCDPQWRRELRFGVADRIDGDASDGAAVVAGGGRQMFVWHRVEAEARRYSEPGECDWCYGQARMTRLPLDDLVARLRADAAMNLELPEVSHLQRSGALELEAADEIQRLLAERDRYYNERNECRALLSHVDSNAYAEALAKHKSLPWQSP